MRQNAHFLLRHFPTKNDVLQAGGIEEQANKLGAVHSTQFLLLYYRLVGAHHDRQIQTQTTPNG
ncbi:hypothetical protein [Pseudomonas viridiflava]|uniref:hypothetical protein n=1 Tax=Pseudomonas viridiflava TaxID=33069 RepID=UPI0031451873